MYNTDMDIVWFILGGLVIIVAFMFLFTAFTGAPYVPSSASELEEAFTKLYKLGKKDLLIDLGSGDGIVLKMARRHGAQALGVEINPLLVLITRIRLRKEKHVRVVCKNFFKMDFPAETTVVYAFGDSRDIKKIAKLIQKQAARLGHPIYLISNAFEVKGLAIAKQHRAHYLYKITGGKDEN